ncbi:MAG: hypothetical protein Udaeo2_05400 [Candidatus Udaeobacter sp.]|nr:MAG: hypothetical protein Udaeo2_05400 [Candidatus Udaeobacter sp.]
MACCRRGSADGITFLSAKAMLGSLTFQLMRGPNFTLRMPSELSFLAYPNRLRCRKHGLISLSVSAAEMANPAE